MVSRENFSFTIGFDGGAAIVDKKAKSAFGRLDSGALFDKGLFRAAFGAALHLGDEAQMRSFLDRFNALAGTKLAGADDGSRLFGLYKYEVDSVVLY
jgi:hypothetical protein